MDTSIGSTASAADEAAMDLFASVPPSASQEEEESSLLASSSSFADALMDDIFPRQESDNNDVVGSAIFQEDTTATTGTLQLPSSGIPSTSRSPLDIEVEQPTLSGEALLALEHQQQQQQSQVSGRLGGGGGSTLPLALSSTTVGLFTDTPPSDASSSTSTNIPTTTTTTIANANAPPTTSTSNNNIKKRGRGRPRKAPNAPTRTKYARITKEEMSDEDDNNDLYLAGNNTAYNSTTTRRPTSSNSRRSGSSLNLAASSSAKGKERIIWPLQDDVEGRVDTVIAAGGSSSTTSMEDRKGGKNKRPPVMMTEMRTKSGRMVHKPEVYVPTFEPSFRRRKAPQARASTESPHCSICNQGHSPPSNQIILCDSCNTPYHQLCHDPPIPNDILQSHDNTHLSASTSTSILTPPSLGTWFCRSCELKRSSLFPQLAWEDSVPASGFALENVNEYLNILPHSNLVSLIWSTIQHYPEARLFPPNLPQLLEEDRTRRAQVRQNRENANLNDRRGGRRASYSPGNAMLTESTAKRKRDSNTAATATTSSLMASQTRSMYAESDDSEESEEDDDRDLRKSKTPRLATSGISMSTVAQGGGGGGSESTPSPSKGNATTQTDDYLLLSEEGGGMGIRYPSHPEDRPGSMSYFEMLRNAIREINDPEGVPPRRLYEWIAEKYNLPANFRPSAGQALQKAAKKGHFLKTGSLYRINPEHENMKAVKRPVRKARPSDASQSTTTTSSHQRNISNQTTTSTRSSNYTSASTNDGARTVTSEGQASEHNPESIQGESTRSTISLEEVIARQNSAAANAVSQPAPQAQQSTSASDPSPISAFAAIGGSTSNSVSMPPAISSPQIASSSANVTGQYFPNTTSSGTTFDAVPRPPPQRQHRPSISFGGQQEYTIASPQNISLQQPMQQQQQPQSLPQSTFPSRPQFQPAQSSFQSQGPHLPRRQSDAQMHTHVYAASGDAGIDSMLADLMRQSPADRMGMQAQQARMSPVTGMSSVNTAIYTQQPQPQNQPTMSGSVSPLRQPRPIQMNQQQAGPAMSNQTLQSRPVLGHPQAQQPAHMIQQQRQHQHQQQQQQAQQMRSFQPQQSYMSNATDPAIFTGMQYIPSQSSQIQPFQAQYGYQPQLGFSQQRPQMHQQPQLRQQLPQAMQNQPVQIQDRNANSEQETRQPG